MVDLRVYQDAGVEQLVASMMQAGAQGKVMQGEQRFWIHWPGGCHVTSAGSKNDPPLVIRQNAVSGKAGAYCYTCEHEALTTIHALLGWQPEGRPAWRGNRPPPVAREAPSDYECVQCGGIAYRSGSLCTRCARGKAVARQPARPADRPETRQPARPVDRQPEATPPPPPAVDTRTLTYAEWCALPYPADDYAGIERILDRNKMWPR